jgi:DNA-binding transcriptional regulator YdaS (Cro superfamily)
MTLENFLALEGSPTMTKLAADIGVTTGRLSQLRDSTDWPADLALKVEEATSGKLNASVLSPVIARARKTAA